MAEKMGRPRLELVKHPRMISIRLNKETDRSIEMLAARFELYKSDLAEAALRLLLEVLENPGVINIDGIRDAELRGFLFRLVDKARG